MTTFTSNTTPDLGVADITDGHTLSGEGLSKEAVTNNSNHPARESAGAHGVIMMASSMGSASTTTIPPKMSVHPSVLVPATFACMGAARDTCDETHGKAILSLPGPPLEECKGDTTVRTLGDA